MENFEIGTQVKVLTDKGIVEGIISEYWGTTGNQFAVRFIYNELNPCLMTFSKKTGKLFRCSLHKKQFIKVIF